PFEELFGPDLPRMIKTTLLPFKGRITYDGLMSGYNISFGPGIRRSLNDGYNEAKARQGIITQLPPPADLAPAAEPKAAAGKRSSKGSKKSRGEVSGASPAAAARAAHDQIVALIDDVCRKRLDDEYATMCRKLAGVLARKRPSPLTRGKPESWA